MESLEPVEIFPEGAELSRELTRSEQLPRKEDTALFVFPTGDMKIKVTYQGQSIIGHVNAGSMSAASPVWQKFINPPWTVGPVAAEKEIDCGEDNGEALLILLRIAHLQFREIKQPAVLETFYQLALLCEQYLCHNLLQPWVKKWIRRLVEQMKLKTIDRYATMDGRWAFILWAFGESTRFSDITKEMVRRAEVADDTTFKRFTDPDDVLPEDLLESIQRARSHVIPKMLELVFDHRARCASSESIICCNGNSVCDKSVVDAFYLRDEKVGLAYECSPERRHCSYSINWFTIMAVGQSSEAAYIDSQCTGHDCGIKYLKYELGKIAEDVSDPTLSAHRRHMASRAAELKIQDPSDSDESCAGDIDDHSDGDDLS